MMAVSTIFEATNPFMYIALLVPDILHMKMSEKTTQSTQAKRVLPSLSLLPRLTTRLFFKSFRIEGRNSPKDETKLPEICTSYSATKETKEAGRLETFGPAEKPSLGFILTNNEQNSDKRLDSEGPVRVQGLRLPPIQNVSCWELAKSTHATSKYKEEASLYPGNKVDVTTIGSQRQASALRNKLPPLTLPVVLPNHGTSTSAIPSSQLGEKEDKTNEEVIVVRPATAEPVWQQQQQEDLLLIRTENNQDSTEVTGILVQAASFPAQSSPGRVLTDACLDEPEVQKLRLPITNKSENSSYVMVHPGNTERTCWSAKDSGKHSGSQDGRPKTTGGSFQTAEMLLCKDTSSEDVSSSHGFEQIAILNGTELADLDFTDDDTDTFHGKTKYQHSSSRTLLASLVDKHKDYFYSDVTSDNSPILPYKDQLELILNQGKTLQTNQHYTANECHRTSPPSAELAHPNAIDEEDREQETNLFYVPKQFNSMETLTGPVPEVKSGTKQKLLKRQPRKSGSTAYVGGSKYVIESTDPRTLLENAVRNLSSSDWEKKVHGISEIVELSKHHQASLLPQLHHMNLALLAEVRNLRSQVSRAAIQAFVMLFESCGKAMEPDVDKIGHTLLHKSGDTNKFIREDAHAALQAMVNNISPPRAISCIVNEGLSHKSAMVRAETARLLVKIVELLGGAKSLSGAKDVTEKLLPAAAQLLQEGSQDARTNAKKMFAILISEPVFDKAIHKYVSPTVLRNIQRTLDSIRRNGLNTTMPIPVTRNFMSTRRLDGTFY